MGARALEGHVAQCYLSSVRRLWRFASLAGIAATAALLSQCQVVGGFAGYDIRTSGRGGAASVGGGGSGGSGGVQDACRLREVPSPPPGAGGEGGGSSDVSFTLAVRRVDLGESMTKTLGFDIDDACSCGDEACRCASAPACSRPGAASADPWQGCDGPGGIDANSPKLYAALRSFSPLFNSAGISSAIEGGFGTVLFDVSQYNGEANDGMVRVGVYTTGSFFSSACNDEGEPPAWDGQDEWPIDDASSFFPLAGCGQSPQPSFFDASAYVVDHQLVARLSQVSFVVELLGARLRLRLVDAIAVAPLQRDEEGAWSTAGATLAGYWPAQEVFRALAELDAGSVLNLCESDLRSTQLTICNTVDATPSNEDVPCDAVSFAAEFDAQEAKFGNTVEIPSVTPCEELTNLDCETPP